MSDNQNNDLYSDYNFSRRYTKTGKEMLVSIVFTCVFATIIIGIIWAGSSPYFPSKLPATNYTIPEVVKNGPGYPNDNPVFEGRPAIVDNVGIVNNPNELMTTFNDYYEFSGICPVLISFYEDDFLRDGHRNGGAYATTKYGSFINQENTYCLVFVLTRNERHYDCYEFRGNMTKLLISDKASKQIAEEIGANFKQGVKLGDSINTAFRNSKDVLYRMFNPAPAEKAWIIIKEYFFLAVAIVIFGTILIVLIRNYIKAKKAGEEPRNDRRYE